MAYPSGDTIAAIATPPGQGGIGIIRLSGPLSIEIAKKITGLIPVPRHAHLTNFLNRSGANVDSGILLYFKSPNSFTGEDVVELQAHGGTVILDTLIATCCHFGARLAKPGEFSFRAFLNQKLDLVQAEGIADLIGASSERAVISAHNSLQGKFSDKVKQISDELLNLRILIEASLDFPEEEIDALQEEYVLTALRKIKEKVESLKRVTTEGQILQDGLNLVLSGSPNVGKSTLLNALTGSPRAIVSDVPGTTRDTIEERILLNGIPIKIVDTAGIRDTNIKLEQEGIKRTIAEIKKADHALIMFDLSKIPETDYMDPDSLIKKLPQIPAPTRKTLILNKSDLAQLEPNRVETNGYTIFTLSAATGEGVAELKIHLQRELNPRIESSEGTMSARRRHLVALERCQASLDRAVSTFATLQQAEILAEDLKNSMTYLGEITGEICNEELLGEIFSKFCIGK